MNQGGSEKTCKGTDFTSRESLELIMGIYT